MLSKRAANFHASMMAELRRPIDPSELPPPRPVVPLTGPAGTLVLMACGGQKIDTAEPVPLHQLYAGPMWATLRAHIGAIPWENVFVLSGLYGFVPATMPSRRYDALLTEHKAARFIERGAMWPNDRFGTLRHYQKPTDCPWGLLGGHERSFAPFTRVIIGAAGHYRRCFDHLVEHAAGWPDQIARSAPVLTVAGGIGQQRQQLAQHLAAAQLPDSVQQGPGTAEPGR